MTAGDPLFPRPAMEAARLVPPAQLPALPEGARRIYRWKSLTHWWGMAWDLEVASGQKPHVLYLDFDRWVNARLSYVTEGDVLLVVNDAPEASALREVTTLRHLAWPPGGGPPARARKVKLDAP